jgi:4-amino-4-deoxy-L-arabinose transferase-like glycosyltransferase/cytochrome c-type biogenesis protein CcmH/NrfG
MISDGVDSDSGAGSDRAASCIGKKSTFILFIFALGFRLIYVIQSIDNPLFGVPLIDAYSYVQWAEKMVDGIWLWDSVGNYLPLYPAFLAVQQIVFGVSPLVNKILQSIMGAGTAVLLAQVAARAWHRQVGLISGYLIATYWMLVVFESEKFAETFSIFFLSLTLWCLIHRPHRYWAILAAGFTFALSAGVRANLFLVLPCICGWLVWQNRSQKAAALKTAALFACGSVLIIGPIVARNYYLTGAPMLRAQATWSLYSGLAPEFKGLHPPAGILFKKYMRLPNQAGAFTEPEVEKFWAQKLGDVIGSDPGGVAYNFLRRGIIFMNAREWSQEFDVAAYRKYSWFLSLPWTGFWLVGPLGLLGLSLCRKSTPAQKLLIVVTISVILSIIPFKVSDRYRLPAAVLLTMFAALVLWYFYLWFKTGNRRALYRWIPICAVLCLICWPDWQNLAARKSARHDFFTGKHYEDTGRLDDAIRAYRKSMQEFPWDPDSPYRLGRIFARLGQDERALEYLAEALQRESEFPEVFNEIARLKIKAGYLKTAEAQLTGSLKLAPANLEALLLMADVQRRLGNTQAEIEYLAQGVVKTGRYQPSMLLADRFTELENYAEAVQLYDFVMRSRQVDKRIRVAAAMMAGITQARFLNDPGGAGTYWNYVVNQFEMFKFFSLQAKFLNGTVTEETFRQQMGDSPDWKVSAEYVIGLKHWMHGDLPSAAQAFERCLQTKTEKKSSNRYSPQKWAREDLQRIQKAQTSFRN